jgi:tetratricopeptide (TPR) repeat protein
VAKPAPKPAPPPAPKPAAVSGEAKDYYVGGVKALNQGAFNKSIEQFSKCIQADKNYGLCYRAMGITYARMQNGPKAARYYRLYLKVNPNAKDADKVRQFLKQYEGQ